MARYRGGDTEDYIVARTQRKKTGRDRIALVVEDVHFTDMAGLLVQLGAP